MTLKKTRKPISKARVLFLDIETTPLTVYKWSLHAEESTPLNMLIEDWSILSWSAKWADSSKIFYMDTRKERNVRNDQKIVKGIWKLVNEADVIVTQNGKKFDMKKLNSRFLFYKLPPPSSYRQVDTLTIARRHFAHTSNKLEYMTKKFCSAFEKSSHSEFPGFELWKACLAKNQKAFRTLQAYNEVDVLSLEELYNEVKGWDSSINHNVFIEAITDECGTCGGNNLRRNGFRFTNNAKYQRYTCHDCGSESRGTENLLPKEKRKSLKAR